MKNVLLKNFRKWHRNIAAALFLFFFIISLTGFLLGWKNIFNKEVYRVDKKVTDENDQRKWLSIDSLQKLAISALKAYEVNEKELTVDRIDIKPGKSYFSLQFSNNYLVSLDPTSGTIKQIDIKRSSWILKLHEGSLLDDWFGTSFMKKTYVSIMGLALFFMTASGTYLYFFSKRKRFL